MGRRPDIGRVDHWFRVQWPYNPLRCLRFPRIGTAAVITAGPADRAGSVLDLEVEAAVPPGTPTVVPAWQLARRRAGLAPHSHMAAHIVGLLYVGC